jgi:hypothetical protein
MEAENQMASPTTRLIEPSRVMRDVPWREGGGCAPARERIGLDTQISLLLHHGRARYDDLTRFREDRRFRGCGPRRSQGEEDPEQVLEGGRRGRLLRR